MIALIKRRKQVSSYPIHPEIKDFCKTTREMGAEVVKSISNSVLIDNSSVPYAKSCIGSITFGQELVISRVGEYYGFRNPEVKLIQVNTPFVHSERGSGMARHRRLNELVTLDGPTNISTIIISDLFVAARPDLFDVKHSLKGVNYRDGYIFSAIRSTLGFGYGADSQAVHQNPRLAEALDRSLHNYLDSLR